MPAGVFPGGVAITPDGARAYVSDGQSAGRVRNDTATNNVIASIPIGAGTGLAINPRGTRAYVGAFGSNFVAVIDTATNTVVKTVTVGSVVTEACTAPPKQQSIPLRGAGPWNLLGGKFA